MKKLLLLTALLLACQASLRAQYTFFTPQEAFAIEVSLPNSAELRLPMHRNAITSLHVQDDRIIGGTTAKEGLSPYLFVASISDRKLVTVKDLQTAVPGQKSIATGFCKGKGDLLYAGTLAQDKQAGHLLQVSVGNVNAIDVKDLGVPVPGEGVFSLLSNRDGSELYGISYPSGRFFTYQTTSKKVQVYDEVAPKEKELHNLHEYAVGPEVYLGKALVQDNAGVVYGSTAGNRLFAFDPVQKRFSLLETPLPAVWGREVLGQVEAWAKSPDGKLYGGNAGDGQLFVLDPATKKIKNLGKPMMMGRLQALAFGGDGKLYGLAGGAPGYSHLFSYNENEGFVDLGNPEFRMVAPGIDQGILWRGFQLSTLAASADGKYMVMGEDEALSQLMIFPTLAAHAAGPWQLRALPPSLRLDPVSNTIIEHRFKGASQSPTGNALEKNWIYDGKQVALHGARGEYVSFQLVLSNESAADLTGIQIEMTPFKNGDMELPVKPELFLEWSVNVLSPSTGYPRSTLGTGWYPDALIPFKHLQTDSAQVHGRWVYPLTLPDFNNRIPGQRSQVIWVDQFIPLDARKARPGTYRSVITATIGGQKKQMPVSLTVWDFELPNENIFKASLQHEGFLSRMDEKQELAVYQLFKRNRISLMDPTYDPKIQVLKNGKVAIQWDQFDKRLKKYLTGAAFTAAHGYHDGPGYGEPLETFALPFDVYGKHGTAGWPDIGKPEVERNAANQAIYTSAIRQVRAHLLPMVNPKKTLLTVYLNGLDESYFPEAWSRMVFYGKLFKKEYPEAKFRVDGGYTKEAMDVIGSSITDWASHTINYNIDTVRSYQQMGIKDWLYGPMLYEAKLNSWVGSSTFIDLPLVNDRAISWACWKYKTFSWISWGIGAGWERGWYDPESWKDFYKEASEADAEFTYRTFNGNGSLIYKPGMVPNVSEPCPSIRLKTMRDGVQEYEYLRLLAKLDGNSKRADELVNQLIKEPFGDQSIGNLDVWSYDLEKWHQVRIQLGELISRGKK